VFFEDLPRRATMKNESFFAASLDNSMVLVYNIDEEFAIEKSPLFV
jgi:hypothetical protein